jgi:AAA ATPase domain
LRRFDAIRITRRHFFTVQAQRLGKITTYSQVFIPAGRSFFAILQSSIFSFLSSNKAIDPFLTEFGSFYEDIKTPRSANIPREESDRKLKSKIDNLTETILQGKHVIEKGRDFLLLSDGRKISLASSSSGQQEMLPLALILGSIPFTRLTGSSGNVVYIEEPEAHLFPTAQRSIVNLIATIFNESKIPVQFIITTHSPYILAAFNNLIHAGNVSSKLPSNEISRLEGVVPEEQLIKSDNMRVYSLHNGTCESIISEETGLISTNLLDAVSDELALQFDRILEIEE